MAAFTGFKLVANRGDAASPDTAIRQAFYNAVVFNDPNGNAVNQGKAGFFGAKSATTLISVKSANKTGQKLQGYADIFYNRMLITPNPLNVGNITADVVRTLKVFNAFFTSKTLNSITSNNLDGIILTGPTTPLALSSLQEVDYILNISVSEGPPTIDGNYLFDFEVGVNDITVDVTGSRVLTLPHLFQPGLQELINFSTKIITSNNGKEQRMKLRSSPRQEFVLDIAITPGEIPELDLLLYEWRANNFALPISSESRFLISPTSTSSPNIAVNTEFADFRVGGLAVIYADPQDFELVEIVSLTTNEIVANSNISKIYGTSALVMPVRITILRGNPVRSTDGKQQRLKATFQSIENITLPTSPSVQQYKSLDVFLDEPLTINGFAPDSYNKRVDIIDYGTGVLDTFSPWLKTKTQRNFGLQFDDAEQSWTFRLWLHRREGRLRPFWMPTFESDFTLITVGLLDIQLQVVNEGQNTLSTERNDLAIRDTNGTWLFREIISIIPSGNDLLVTVDTSIGIQSDTVDLISFMGRKRLFSDRVGITWTGNNTGRSSVPMIEINN